MERLTSRVYAICEERKRDNCEDMSCDAIVSEV